MGESSSDRRDRQALLEERLNSAQSLLRDIADHVAALEEPPESREAVGPALETSQGVPDGFLTERTCELATMRTAPQVVVSGIEGLGAALGEVTIVDEMPAEGLTAWTCLIPKRMGEWISWLDIVLGVPLESCGALYSAITGESEPESEGDVVDLVQEVLNLAQGALKTALEAEGLMVLTPFLPMCAKSSELPEVPTPTEGRITFRLSLDEVSLFVQLTDNDPELVLRDTKALEEFDVLAYRLNFSGSSSVGLLKRGRPLTSSEADRVHELNEQHKSLRGVRVVNPSPQMRAYLKAAKSLEQGPRING